MIFLARVSHPILIQLKLRSLLNFLLYFRHPMNKPPRYCKYEVLIRLYTQSPHYYLKAWITWSNAPGQTHLALSTSVEFSPCFGTLCADLYSFWLLSIVSSTTFNSAVHTCPSQMLAVDKTWTQDWILHPTQVSTKPSDSETHTKKLEILEDTDKTDFSIKGKNLSDH